MAKLVNEKNLEQERKSIVAEYTIHLRITRKSRGVELQSTKSTDNICAWIYVSHQTLEGCTCG